MYHLFCFDHFHYFKLNMPTNKVFNQSHTAAEEHGNEVDEDFVNETVFDQLLWNVRAAYSNVLISGYLLRFFKRGFNAIHKCINSSRGYIIWHSVGDDDRWYPSRGDGAVCAPIGKGFAGFNTAAGEIPTTRKEGASAGAFHDEKLLAAVWWMPVSRRNRWTPCC